MEIYQHWLTPASQSDLSTEEDDHDHEARAIIEQTAINREEMS